MALTARTFASLPSVVLRTMQRMNLSSAMMLYFQTRLLMDSMAFVTNPAWPDLLNSKMRSSQRVRRWAMRCLYPMRSSTLKVHGVA